MCANFTTILAALLTPTVAVLGVFIGYRQWRLAQNKLKFDLFDRRFKVYEAAMAFLSSIMATGEVKVEELWKYTSATREAKWLLSAEVAEYLDKQLRFKAIDLQRLDAELEGVGVGEVRTKNAREKAEVKKWLLAQYEALDKHFKPFLLLSH